MKSEPKVEEIKITSENRRELELELKRTMTAEGKNRALKNMRVESVRRAENCLPKK